MQYRVQTLRWGAENKGLPRIPGPLPWIRQCDVLWLTLNISSGLLQLALEWNHCRGIAEQWGSLLLDSTSSVHQVNCQLKKYSTPIFLKTLFFTYGAPTVYSYVIASVHPHREEPKERLNGHTTRVWSEALTRGLWVWGGSITRGLFCEEFVVWGPNTCEVWYVAITRDV